MRERQNDGKPGKKASNSQNEIRGITPKQGFYLLVVLSVLAGLVAFISQQPGGYFETKGGSTCAWRTEGDASEERALKVDCTCAGGIKYSCKYQGDPQVTCPAFWRDLYGFFIQMIAALEGQFYTTLLVLAVNVCGCVGFRSASCDCYVMRRGYVFAQM